MWHDRVFKVMDDRKYLWYQSTLPGDTVARTRIYTSSQVALGSLFGGPIAALFFIHQNFQALRKNREASLTLMLGAIAIVAFLLTLPFLPENFPGLVIPLAYTLLATSAARHWHPSKETIASGKQYDFQPNWRVCFTALVALFLIVLMAVAAMLGLSTLGMLDLR